MSPPRLPGDPHLVTLGYLLGIIALAALVCWVILAWRAAQPQGG